MTRTRAELKAMLIDAGIPKSKPWLNKAVDALEVAATSRDVSLVFDVLDKVDPQYKPHGLQAILQLNKRRDICLDAVATAWCAGSTSMLTYYGPDGVCDLFRKYRSPIRHHSKPLTVWRGSSPTTPVKGFSWTTNLSVACFYSVGRSGNFNSGHVVRTTLEPEQILFSKLGPPQYEVVTDPRTLGDVYLEDFTDCPPLITDGIPNVSRVVRKRWMQKALMYRTKLKFLLALGVQGHVMNHGFAPTEKRGI